MPLGSLVARVSVGVLLAAGTAPSSRPPGVYWQDRACSEDHRWCVEWVRLRDDGRLQVSCVWRGHRGWKDPDGGSVSLIDESGRRYDHVATSGAAAHGARTGFRDEARGSFVFRAPAGRARSFTLHDDASGLTIPGIGFDPMRRSSSDASRALLGPLRHAERIAVRRSWNGLAPRADRRLELTRDDGGGFAGRETEGPDELASARWQRTPAAGPRDVRLTREQARLFLETLAGSAAVGGSYQPTVVLDDYPDIEIAIATPAGTTVFVTQSSGVDHVPWSLRTNGRTFVVPSAHPGRALRYLQSVADGAPAPDLLAEPDDASRPLRIAAQRGDAAEIARLLARGAPIDERTPYDGETALTAAARHGQAGVVRLLLEKGADPDLPNAAGVRAVVLASEGSHVDVVKLLAGRTAGGDALTAAARAGSTESVDALLGSGASGADAGEALYHAAAHGSAAVVRSLLAAKAPVNDWKQYRGRPLDGALKHGHLETARLLVAGGADLTGGVNQWPALLNAACVGHVDLIELLLEAGADVNAAYPPDGRTALSLARTPGTARVLLRAGADANARRLDGATPLAALTDWACGQSHDSGHPRRDPPATDVLGTARALLDAGSELDARDAQGATVLHRALAEPLRGDNRALAVLLLERGADPNAEDPNGVRPLQRALETYAQFENAPGATAQEPVIRALVEAGARNLPNRSGATPRDFAAKLRDPARLLALLSDLKR